MVPWLRIFVHNFPDALLSLCSTPLSVCVPPPPGFLTRVPSSEETGQRGERWDRSLSGRNGLSFCFRSRVTIQPWCFKFSLCPDSGVEVLSFVLLLFLSVLNL